MMQRHRTRHVVVGLYTVFALLLGFVASAGSVSAATPAYVVAGDDPAVTGDQWGFHEAYFSELRAIITDPANFGPSGVVNATFSIGAPRVLPLTAHSLDGVDVYFLSARDVAAGEVAVLNAFTLRGGAIIVNSNAPGFFDDTAWLGFTLSARVVYGDGAAPYGSTHQAPSPSAAIAAQAASPLFAGPFGTATTFENWHTVAGFSALPPQATALARTTLTGPDNNGSSNFITINNVATLATIPAGAFGVGSGPIIVTSDVDTYSNAYTATAGTPPTLIIGYLTDSADTLNGAAGNGKLARNSFAWIAAQKAAVAPPPTTTSSTTTTTSTTTTVKATTTVASTTTVKPTTTTTPVSTTTRRRRHP